ncbi:hypothetical protein EVAR_77731_1 [Eumeta japonica]|uniref:Uncharacterized protein n=1 Tax=Eumeta variegata TaxID=151549 RepID=A0A4C1TE68_EUMVA|nr:hypothetical protein EVAR_77731_1 [Eumeta japonica]
MTIAGVLPQVQYNARNCATLNFLQTMLCADITHPDPSLFSLASLFYAIATFFWLTLQRQNFVRCTIQCKAGGSRPVARRRDVLNLDNAWRPSVHLVVSRW